METKRVSSVKIIFNNKRELEIKENKFRVAVAQASNKYHDLLNKYKKELSLTDQSDR